MITEIFVLTGFFCLAIALIVPMVGMVFDLNSNGAAGKAVLVFLVLGVILAFAGLFLGVIL